MFQMNPKLFFHEDQYFRQGWLWLIFALVEAAVIVVLGVEFYQAMASRSTEQSSAAAAGMPEIFWVAPMVIILCALAALLLFMTRLTTEVRYDGLYVRFFPFHLSRPQIIPLKGIRRWQVVTYRPLIDYGGWGIRWGLKGKAYTVSGKQGVRIEFHDRAPLLIGTQRPDEFASALRQVVRT